MLDLQRDSFVLNLGSLQATLVIFLLMLLMVDLLFLNEGDFKYDPDYKVRQRDGKTLFIRKKFISDKLSTVI